MADFNEIMASLGKIDGTEALRASLQEYHTSRSATIDDLKGQANSSATQLEEATRSRDAFEADLKLANAGSGDQIAQLTSARDEALAAAAASAQGLVNYRTKNAVRNALSAKGLSGSALQDATSLFQLPEGATLEGDNLVGATSAINAFVKARPHLLGGPKGDGGGRGGAGEPAGGKPRPADPDTQYKQEYDSFRKELEDMHTANIPAAYR